MYIQREHKNDRLLQFVGQNQKRFNNIYAYTYCVYLYCTEQSINTEFIMLMISSYQHKVRKELVLGSGFTVLQLLEYLYSIILYNFCDFICFATCHCIHAMKTPFFFCKALCLRKNCMVHERRSKFNTTHLTTFWKIQLLFQNDDASIERRTTITN